MTKREARKAALNAAGNILEGALAEGWPNDGRLETLGGSTDADHDRLAAELQRIADTLGMRFARLVHADVRRARRG